MELDEKVTDKAGGPRWTAVRFEFHMRRNGEEVF